MVVVAAWCSLIKPPDDLRAAAAVVDWASVVSIFGADYGLLKSGIRYGNCLD